MLISENTYVYSNTNWKDQLTSFNGSSIIYDQSGNPTTYKGVPYQWDSGRQLRAIGSDIEYTYGDDGLRTSKTVEGETTTFDWIDGKLVSQSDSIYGTLYFYYNNSGEIIGFRSDEGEMYTYEKNLQGDITGIIDENGVLVAYYKYDGYGNILAARSDLNDQKYWELIYANPFRYRGYYQDYETGHYYLQSRYYDAQTGRFLNADALEMIKINYMLGKCSNMFAYCDNNPVNKDDHSGYLGKHWWNSVKAVGIALDVIIILISGVKARMAQKALKTFLKKNKNKVVHQIKGKVIKLFGKATAAALPGVIDIAVTLLGSSIGEMIAKALDYIDPWWGFKRSNGYILN